VLIVRSSQL